jgi:hypothetical protein
VKPDRSTIFLAIFLAVGALLMVGSGIYLLVDRNNYLAKIADWKRAETCSAATARIGDCTATLDATVTGIRLGNRSIEIDLVAGRTSYHPYFSHSQLGHFRGIRVGDTVPVEVWRGQVVAVAGVPTGRNPDLISSMATSPLPGIALILIGLAICVTSVWLWLGEVRRP